MDQSYPNITANVSSSERATFIQRTYNHLAGAILAFTAISYAIQMSPLAVKLTNLTMGSRLGWIITLVLFMGVSHFAEKWARSNASREKQYAGLAIYVVAQAIIFTPLFYIANYYFSGEQIIAKAGIITLTLVASITFIAFTSGKDFSFMGSFLRMASFVALGCIIASLIFGFTLGIVFSAAMILLTGGTLLYQTSAIIRTYPTTQYVAASLSLFASVALMLWYIIQLLMSLSRN